MSDIILNIIIGLIGLLLGFFLARFFKDEKKDSEKEPIDEDPFSETEVLEDSETEIKIIEEENGIKSNN